MSASSSSHRPVTFEDVKRKIDHDLPEGVWFCFDGDGAYSLAAHMNCSWERLDKVCPKCTAPRCYLQQRLEGVAKRIIRAEKQECIHHGKWFSVGRRPDESPADQLQVCPSAALMTTIMLSSLSHPPRLPNRC